LDAPLTGKSKEYLDNQTLKFLTYLIEISDDDCFWDDPVYPHSLTVQGSVYEPVSRDGVLLSWRER
jgi:hypothetical protein